MTIVKVDRVLVLAAMVALVPEVAAEEVVVMVPVVWARAVELAERQVRELDPVGALAMGRIQTRVHILESGMTLATACQKLLSACRR